MVAAFLYYVIAKLERGRRVEVLGKVNAELKSAQELLQKREAEARRLAQAASKTHNSVMITHLDGRLVWVNGGFTRVTGYSLDEVIGRKPGSFLQGPATAPDAIRKMREALAAGRGFQTEVINYTKAGTSFSRRSTANPLSRTDAFPASSRSGRTPRIVCDWRPACASANIACAWCSNMCSMGSSPSTKEARLKWPTIRPADLVDKLQLWLGTGAPSPAPPSASVASQSQEQLAAFIDWRRPARRNDTWPRSNQRTC